jgi:nitrogen-specific signal transduction histidine kinase
MKLLLSPVVLRMSVLLLMAVAAFVLGAFVIHRLRRNLVATPESLTQAPLPSDGMPVHAYHAVIQQLKQQKHELTAQQFADRRRAKAADTISATVLANLSCGVLFFNTSGLVRQANSAARKLLGFASPVGMNAAELFRTAKIRPDPNGAGGTTSVEETLAPALSGQSVVRGLITEYAIREGGELVLELTASPVLAEDASWLGTSFVINDKTEIEQIRHEGQMHQEISSELALGLRNSLATIAGYAQQLAQSGDPEQARQLADDIAKEAATLDRTTVRFLAGAKTATAGF